MYFKIITFGCKVNTYESEFINEQLVKAGYKETDDNKLSDIVVVNTCSVTNTADNKCLKFIRQIKRENPNAILVVCGCSAEHNKEKYIDMDIDVLIGNKDKSKIVELINNYINDKKKYYSFCDDKRLVFEDMKIDNFNLTRAFVKIQDGCNNYCAFCVIPYVRGNIRSKDLNEAIEEIKSLVDNGYKEIVLTGINTGAYGRETGAYDLTDLIKEISKFDNLRRIRISSIEITEITDKFIEELKNNKKICGHLHISLQSGSKDTLKRMGRKYSKEDYLAIVDKIKDARTDVNLTTDVIVGFPGETLDEFKESIDFCKLVGFSKIHVFPYSIRNGTKAATMPNQIDNKVKKDRSKELIKVSNELQLKFNEKFVDRIVNVLIEENDNNKSIGHTENFLKVVINDILKKNNDYQIKIIKAHADYVEGIIAN